jgi:hypothetical protein
MIEKFSKFKANLLESAYSSDLLDVTTEIINLMGEVSKCMQVAAKQGLIKTGIVNMDVLSYKNNWLFYFDEATESQSELDAFFKKNCKPYYIGTAKDSKTDDTFFLKFKS